MGVKQMSSTAYLSDSEEEAMIMAQEQSIRFLKEVTDTDLEQPAAKTSSSGAEGFQGFKSVGRDDVSEVESTTGSRVDESSSSILIMCQDNHHVGLLGGSGPYPTDKEEWERAHERILLSIDSLMKAKEEARVLQQPSQGLKIQN
ncbi:hypothetical protein F2Q68_00027050 [Brassica cretica]|uniref:Uncharacterized protein n=1 Tax=Brassica cretica TaxID=69181 RepID=A0A8S9ID81_BRACR|nr:hypothetical protein F2Q68_00027050 [Brassica cretica]